MIDIEKSHINVRRNASFDEIAKEKLSTKAYYKKHFLDILREQENAPHSCGGCTPPQVILLNLRIIPK